MTFIIDTYERTRFELQLEFGGYTIFAIDESDYDFAFGEMILVHIYKAGHLCMMVTHIEVDPVYRRKGFGGELYKRAIRLSEVHGCSIFSQGYPRSKPAAKVWGRLAREYEVMHGPARGDYPPFSGDYIVLNTTVEASTAPQEIMERISTAYTPKTMSEFVNL